MFELLSDESNEELKRLWDTNNSWRPQIDEILKERLSPEEYVLWKLGRE